MPNRLSRTDRPRSRESRLAQRRRVVRRRRAMIAATPVALLALVALVGSHKGTDHPRSASVPIGQASNAVSHSSPNGFVVRRLAFRLPFALQDAAAVAIGTGRGLLLGGLDAADTSTATVSLLDAKGIRPGASLPEAQHDAQGTFMDGRAYVFGGGQVSSYDHILSYDPATTSVAQAASLPTPTSDAAAAAIAGTAYVVGGYDGHRALGTIVAWRPGERPEVVGRLPYGLRYAALAASGGRLLIAGGSRGEAATTAIFSFDPATQRVRRLGNLSNPTTHAVAVALGSYVYVMGGRGAAAGTQSAAIVAINPTTGRSITVGRLPQPLSDAAALLISGRVLLAGGLSASGPVASVFELTPTAH
ncbi:MAG: Kelch repeat-containing protein [Solirubrobacteraceae bacterium]